MSRKLEYFRKFLANPSAYRNRGFWRMAKQWGKYILEHKSEFNYLEDDEWKEIRERLIADFERRDDIKYDFDELCEELNASEEHSDAQKIDIRQRWQAFVRKHQFDFSVTDEQLADLEVSLEQYILSVEKCEIIGERLRISKMDYAKSIVKLDDSLARHYEQTGKRPVLTALHPPKKLKGN